VEALAVVCVFIFWTAYMSVAGTLDAYLHAWTWLASPRGLRNARAPTDATFVDPDMVTEAEY
jgi:hypothetical protein